MKSVSLKEAYNILESLYPKHFDIHNSYILGQDIDKDMKDLEKWDELYDLILDIEETFGVTKIENKIQKVEQILHYYKVNLDNLPKEYVIAAKEKIKDLTAEMQMLEETLRLRQENTIFEIYEDFIK